MSHSLYLLAATLLAAQTSDPRVVAVPDQPEMGGGAVVSRPGCNCGQSAPTTSQWQWQANRTYTSPATPPRTGFLSRVGRWFRGEDHYEEMQGTSSGVTWQNSWHQEWHQESRQLPMQQPPFVQLEGEPMQVSAEPPLAQPAELKAASPATAAMPVAQTAFEGGSDLKALTVRPDLAGMISHDGSYHHLVGQLFHVGAGEGMWVVRYSADPQDAHGGVVILSTAADMAAFHEGDLVAVDGELLNYDAAASMGAPLFRAAAVDLVDRTE